MSEERERVTAATAAVSAQRSFGPPPGTVLFDRYRVDSLIGLGGSGVVLKATELATGELVAIKLLRDDVNVDEETRVRLMREAAAAVRLRSVHAAKIRDVGTAPDGQPFMVMELLQGMDLGRLLQANQRLDLQFAVDLAFQACDALAEAHGIGIIHRDIKPSNLFVTWLPDGTIRAKVLDFGISKTPQSEGLVITSRAAVLGTPAYMSPEQMRSASNVDVRTDVWSLGAVLYEMVEGRPPFVGSNYADMCVLVSTEQPPPMKEAPTLEPIIQRCLAKDAGGRYASIADLANALAPLTKDPHVARGRVPKLFRMAGKPAPFTSAQIDAVGPELALATGTPLPNENPRVELTGPQRALQPSSPPPANPFATYEQTGVRMKQARSKQPSGPQPGDTIPTGEERALPPSGEHRALPASGEQPAVQSSAQRAVPPSGEQPAIAGGRLPPSGEQRAIATRVSPSGERTAIAAGRVAPSAEQRAIDSGRAAPSGESAIAIGRAGTKLGQPTGEQRAGRGPAAAEQRATDNSRVRTKQGVPSGELPVTAPSGERRIIGLPDNALRPESTAVPLHTIPGTAPGPAPKRDAPANKSGAQPPQSATATADPFPRVPTSEHFAHAATAPSDPHPPVAEDEAPPARGSQPADPLLEPRIPIASGSDPSLDADDLDAHDTVIGAPIDTLREEPDPDMPIPPSDLASPPASFPLGSSTARDAASRDPAPDASPHVESPRDVMLRSLPERVVPRRLLDVQGIAIVLLVIATAALVIVFKLGLLD